jgi:hypothetical protein
MIKPHGTLRVKKLLDSTVAVYAFTAKRKAVGEDLDFPLATDADLDGLIAKIAKSLRAGQARGGHVECWGRKYRMTMKIPWMLCTLLGAGWATIDGSLEALPRRRRCRRCHPPPPSHQGVDFLNIEQSTF